MEWKSAEYSAFIMGNASVLMVLTTACLLEVGFGAQMVTKRMKII
jgi:hypothetical protein